jgi:addiction module HigA family antidote
MKKLPNIHPGEILLEEFLLPAEITQYRLAKSVGVSARRINEIIHGQRSLTADTALRLGLFFGNDPQFWMNLQSHFDLEQERERIGVKLTREIQPLSRVA